MRKKKKEVIKPRNLVVLDMVLNTRCSVYEDKKKRYDRRACRDFKQRGLDDS